MPEILQYLMQQSDEQFKRQIQYILDQLSSQDEKSPNDGAADTSSLNPNEQEEQDFDDEDEEDEDEEEDDEMVEEEEGEFNDIIEE